ncbi:MAG: cadherin-like domain-containing protein [Xanthomonadales bacterium]|nr:cadherin-like domain-containing protein [Xanthomonadales bacterium]
MNNHKSILRAGAVLFAALASIGVNAQSFTETFGTDPCSGAIPCTSFSRDYSGVQFDYVFHTDGDGGDFLYDSDFKDIMLLSFEQNTGTTERVTIRRNDGQPFTFTSIDLENDAPDAQDITITGRLSGAVVETVTAPAYAGPATYTFGDGSGAGVDVVEITSASFEAVLTDNITGEVSLPTPDISINDVSVTEGNTTASFTVSLSESATSTVTVDYATANGTAAAGADYNTTSGTLTFSPGETAKNVAVTVLEDTLYENDETFLVNLSNAANANISDSQGQGVINNDDPAPTVSLVVSGDSLCHPDYTGVVSRVESGDPMCLEAELSAAAGLTTTVNLAYSGTATSGVDYTTATSITIPPGETIDYAVLNLIDDSLDEADETIVADISSVVNGSESGTQQQTFTILDDDETPVVTSGQSFSVNENSGAATIVGTVVATDGDAGTTLQNWTITTNANPDGDGNNAFAFDSSSGQITVNDPGDLDHESNTSLIVQVTVSDGTNTSTAENVTVNITDVDDVAPTMTANTGITVDEGATETINGSELQANDADTNNDNLVFAVTSGPANGQLELTTGPGIAITSFTQAQVNANQVVYVHDDSNTTSDAFGFDVRDGSGNNLTGQAFSITVNPVDDDAPTITANTGITLIEGGTEIIDSIELAADDTDTNNDNLVFAVTSGPSNGQLELITDPGSAITSFTQAQVKDTQVVYVHDDSNTTSDAFGFDVRDGSGNSLTGQVFSVTVEPVDDDAPTITANTGITLNEGVTETINGSELQADDADTNNDNLVFAVTSGPANGQLELTTGPGTAITSFTQAQVNANQVVYVHDGSGSGSDAFTFDVQDGSGNNLTGQQFNITVAFEFNIGGEVSGLQGTGLVLQNNGGDNLPISTDGPFTFATPLLDGSAYEVTVLSQPADPAQNCTIDNPSGVVSGSDVSNVQVTCVTITWTVTFMDHDSTILDTQTVNDGDAATAPPDPTREGYTFTGWDSDFSNVTSDLEVTAQYEINTYTLTYTAGANGVITGDAVQTVDHGSDGTAVTATPDARYRFEQWSDGSADNPRTDVDVQADLSVTAEFAENTSTTALTSSLNPSVYGQPVTLTATVEPDHAATVTGTVSFNSTTQALCTDVALDAGQATCIVDDLSAGAYELTAEYSGDAENQASVSDVLEQQVDLAIAPGTLPDIIAGEHYEVTFTAAGGVPPYTYTVSDGELPPGMTLTSDGQFSGWPNRGGDYAWTLSATDSNGQSGERGYTMGVGFAPALPVPVLHPGLLLLLAALLGGVAMVRLRP